MAIIQEVSGIFAILGAACLLLSLLGLALLSKTIATPGSPGESAPGIDGLLTAIPDVLMLVSRSGSILKKNTAAARLIRGNRLPRDLQETIDSLWSTNDHKKAHTGADGRPYCPTDDGPNYEVRVIPQGKTAQALVLLHDQRSEDELADLVATLSHQVKTPLTAIRLALSLLQKSGDHPLSSYQADLVETALEETDKLGLNVEDLMDLTHIEDSASILEMSRVDPKDLLKNVAERLSPMAGRRDIRIEVSSNSQPRTLVLDRTRIRSVLESLVLNAVRHSPRGSRITLDASVDSVRQMAILSVQDRSAWLDGQNMLKILDRFLSGDAAQPGGEQPNGGANPAAAGGSDTSRRVEDVLGFFVARQIVRAHNGAVKIFCRRKDGCDVELHLPLQRERPRSTDAEPSAEQKDNPYIRPLTRRFWGRITPNL